MRKIPIRKVLAGALAVMLTVTGICDIRFAAAASKKPKKIILNKKTVLLKVKGRISLKVTSVEPPKASKNVTYMVSNRRIATVSKGGVVKGKRPGITTVLAVSKKNKRAAAMVKVMVTRYVPQKVKLSAKTLSITAGSQKQLKAAVTPKKVRTAYKKGTWTTSNKEIASVSGKGVVTALKEGKTKITFTTLNGKKAVCQVTVKENVLEPPSVEPPSTEPPGAVVTTGPAVMPEPTAAATEPAVATPEPTTAATEPAVTTPEPTAAATEPAVVTPEPTAAMTEPTVAATEVTMASLQTKFGILYGILRFFCYNGS